jgi:hypothetical protein
MDKRILIGVSVALVIIIIIIFLMKKKEKYTSSEAESASNNAQVLLTVDDNGNIATATSIDVDNVNVGGSLSVNGLSGNLGDILISNGSGSPSWTGQVPKILVLKPYTVPATVNDGNQIVAVNIPQNLTPNMVIIVDVTCTLKAGGGGLWGANFYGAIGTQKYPQIGGIFANQTGGFMNNFKFIFSELSGTGNQFTLTYVNPGLTAFTVQGVNDYVIISTVQMDGL